MDFLVAVLIAMADAQDYGSFFSKSNFAGSQMVGKPAASGPSADAYLQESGSDYYQTEDGSGVYLLE